ncbi:Aste57867_10919 [Aphanomyces stellatus]|uniref:Aste57867_10919 protein n=1 Tax=Aphanomyces stellatus TaxID=120398 RepID=A0A485KS48_9STRA|nr:hypothetical protein As57867_010879 [Aphanomyces stellatus]VFT87787.1 Aste57867_10919 [Aphanomyces stellatus]
MSGRPSNIFDSLRGQPYFPPCTEKTLVIKLVGARDLPKQGAPPSNVYCVCSLVDHRGRVFKRARTHKIRSSHNPAWNVQLDFGELVVEAIGGVLVTIKHKGKLGLSVTLGSVLLSMASLQHQSKGRPLRWYSIHHDKQATVCGAVQLGVHVAEDYSTRTPSDDSTSSCVDESSRGGPSSSKALGSYLFDSIRDSLFSSRSLHSTPRQFPS